LGSCTKIKDTDIEKALPLVRERMKKLSEFDQLVGFIFSKEIPAVPQQFLLPKEKSRKEAAEALQKLASEFEQTKIWNIQTIEKRLEAVRGNLGWEKGEFYMMVRVAVSGSTVTPPLIESLALMDKRKVAAALEVAAKKL